MALDQAIDRFRRRVRSLFRSTCIITRAGEGSPVLNQETGNLTDPAPTTIYEGPCTIRPADVGATDVQFGEREVRTRRFICKLPPDVPVHKSDVWLGVSSKHNQELVGKELIVRDVVLDEWQIATVVVLEDAS